MAVLQRNIQQIVGCNLVKAGFHVIYADNGEQAFNLIKKERPKLIVLGLMPPLYLLVGLALLQQEALFSPARVASFLPFSFSWPALVVFFRIDNLVLPRGHHFCVED